MPAVAEKSVVCPVGCHRTDSNHRNVVYQIHNYGKYRQAQPTVCDNFIDFVGSRKLADIFLFIASLYDLGDIDISFIGDYTFRIVVKLFFRRFDVGFDMLHDIVINLKLFNDFRISFKDFYCIPSLLIFGHVVKNCFFNVRNCMFNSAAEGVHRHGFAVFGGFDCLFCRCHDSVVFEGGYLYDFAPKLTRKFCNVDFVAVLLYNVHHVDCDDNRYAELCQLCCEVEVSLKVCAVYDV